MMADHPTSTKILAGHGYNDHGPYLLFEGLDEGSFEHFSVLGRTFTLRKSPARRCIGRFDLVTHEREACPLSVELLPDSKETQCPACIKATGFNPSFYYADSISPQQRAYNATPHFVYLAYFSPNHVKAGISSETRGIARLLEQGARAARIVGRFSCADEARALEAALCAQDGVLETMRASLKARLIAEVRFDPAEAFRVLDAAASRLATVPEVTRAGFSPEETKDLSERYFGGPSPDVHDIQTPEGHDNDCGGRCAGMVGSTLLFEQNGILFTAPVKEWESHVVEVIDGEASCSYDVAPQQFSLF